VTSCADPPLSSSITRSGTSPTGAVDLNGTWSGTASDATGQVQVVWRLIQSGATVTGTVTASTNVGRPVYAGSIAGTYSRGIVNLTVTVPPGSIEDLPDCSISLTASATDVQANSIAGTYAGTHSCLGDIQGGRFFLTRT
jgi:hypothetical protein